MSGCGQNRPVARPLSRQCGSEPQIIGAIELPSVIVSVLSHLGLPAPALPRALARLSQLIGAAWSDSAITVVPPGPVTRLDPSPGEVPQPAVSWAALDS